MTQESRSEQRNLIILTPGLCGSSVLAGLLSQAGYWMGDSTFKKADYNTYENEELVELNRRLYADVGHKEDTMVVRESDAHHLAEASQKIDPTRYRSFVDRCNAHQPWVWKDPRLWMTIPFWSRLLDLSNVQFIFLSRDLQQQWISTTLRRQIQTREYLDRYIGDIHTIVTTFLREAGQPCMELVYEDIILRPEATLRRLNDYLGTRLTLDDIKRVYHGPLYRKQRGLRDLVIANLIYFKNYGKRYR